MEHLALVSFTSGGFRYALEASQVLAKWPVQGTTTNSTNLVIRSSAEKTWEWEVSEPVELVHVPVCDIHRVPQFIANQCAKTGLRALAFDAQGIMFIQFPPVTRS